MEIVYEGPDDVLVAGPYELSRGVPIEVPKRQASALLEIPGVAEASPGPSAGGKGEARPLAAEGPTEAEGEEGA